MTDIAKIERLEKLGWNMYYAYQYLTTDASHVRKVMKEWYDFFNFEVNKQEEPVGEDLEEEMVRYIEQHKSELMGYFDIRRIARHFAYWQKQQMKKGAFVPGFKSVKFKLGEEFTMNTKNFDREKAKAYGAKEGDTIIAYFTKMED